MPINRENQKSLEKYREYQREYQRNYVKTHHRDQTEYKKKYAVYKKISIIFRNILL
jgi:hypothetical protein